MRSLMKKKSNNKSDNTLNNILFLIFLIVIGVVIFLLLNKNSGLDITGNAINLCGAGNSCPEGAACKYDLCFNEEELKRIESINETERERYLRSLKADAEQYQALADVIEEVDNNNEDSAITDPDLSEEYIECLNNQDCSEDQECYDNICFYKPVPEWVKG